MRRFSFLTFCYLATFAYCALWKWFLPVTLPAILACLLGAVVVIELPAVAAFPAVLVLASMVGVAWRNWWNAEAFRESLEKLQDETDEWDACEIPDGEPI